MEIISKKDAKSLNLKRYFTGKPCKYGHVSERHTRNGGCVACAYIDNKKYHSENKEKKARRDHRYYYNNKEKVIERVKLYKLNNKESIKAKSANIIRKSK